MRINTALVLVAIFMGVTAKADDSFYNVPVDAKEIKIMAYNVQNLFDAEHDEGKEDYQFLPKSSPWKKNCNTSPAGTLAAFFAAPVNSCTDTDWTDDKVVWKIDQIRLALNAQGDLPDILVLAEVENPNVISRVVTALGYDGFYMTDSPDIRGIDLAVLYKEDKLRPIGFVEQEVKGVKKATRNVSAAHFRLSSKFGNEILGIFPVHWPSQANTTTERLLAANATKDLVTSERRKYLSAGGKYHGIVLGDFNVIDSENPNPIETVLLDKSWNLALKDLQSLAVEQKHPYIDQMPRGTYYYGADKSWNHFDHMLLSSDLTDGKGLDVDVNSYRIHAPLSVSKVIETGERIPFRYNHMASNKSWLGFSDHFAVHVKIRVQ